MNEFAETQRAGVTWLREHAFTVEGQVRRTRTLLGLVHAYHHDGKISKYSAIAVLYESKQMVKFFATKGTPSMSGKGGEAQGAQRLVSALCLGSVR